MSTFPDKIYVSIIEDTHDDLVFFREAIEQTSECVLLISASSVQEYLNSKIVRKNPHFLFLDINLNGNKSIELIPEILNLHPSMQIVMYTEDEEYESLMRAFSLGATGYFIKPTTIGAVCNQIKVLQEGGAVLSSFMARKMILNIQKSEKKYTTSNKLTDKEMITLKYISEGWTYEKIAGLTNISLNGVRARVKRIYKKLNVKSKIGALNKFNELKR